MESYFDLRNNLEEEGVIKERAFTKNYEFSSPSAAASVVLGRDSNGKADWKTEDNKMLKEFNL